MGSIGQSDFDPENEAIMSTRQFDKSPGLNLGQSKQYLRPQPAYRLDKEALKNLLPESENGDSQDDEEQEEEDDTVEIGRGAKKSHRVVEDSRNDDSIQSADGRMGSYGLTYTPQKDTRKRSNDLRKDAQLRLASMLSHKENIDSQNRSSNDRNPRPQTEKRNRRTLGEMHSKAAETYDGSLLTDERPATVTFTTKNTRFGSGTHRPGPAKAGVTENITASENQSFLLPDIPNLSELVSGIYQDGTPIFQRTSKSRFGSTRKASRQASYPRIDAVPIPDDEKAIFVSLKLLQDKVVELEKGRAEAEREVEELQEANAILNREKEEQKRYRRSDSALGSSEEDNGRGRNGRVSSRLMHIRGF